MNTQHLVGIAVDVLNTELHRAGHAQLPESEQRLIMRGADSAMRVCDAIEAMPRVRHQRVTDARCLILDHYEPEA
jgi:hypothetical protein